MSLKKFAPPLSLEPDAGYALLGVLALAYTAAFLVLLVLAADYPLLMILAPVVLWLAYEGIARHGLRRHPRAVVRAHWESSGHWLLYDTRGVEHGARLCGDSLRLARFFILNFRLDEGGRRTLLITPGMLGGRVSRRLSARLRTDGIEIRENLL